MPIGSWSRTICSGPWARACGGVLDADADLARARVAAGLQVLPILIESSEPMVLQLPWETLHHPELGFLGRDPAFALSRRLDLPPPSAPTPEPGSLRVLLFTSLPKDLDPERSRLDVEAEQDADRRPWPPGSPRG